MAHTLRLPRRIQNVLRRAGRPLGHACIFVLRVVFAVVRLAWSLLELLWTGGAHGAWVEREYGVYYRSRHWKEMRVRAIRLSNHRCAVCADRYVEKGLKLTVRHINHERDGKSTYGREDPKIDLIVLCEDHNQKGSRRVREVESWKSAYRWYGALSR